eukprot:SAG11_NODE_574_length_8430_cov_11.461769_6_plen_74_part_00
MLLVEQEVEASDLPVVEQVLLADTARAQLLEEEANLTAEMESAESDESCKVNTVTTAALCVKRPCQKITLSKA